MGPPTNKWDKDEPNIAFFTEIVADIKTGN
jgi:hypothetical protein